MQSEPDFAAPPNLEDVLRGSASRRAWHGRWLAVGLTLVIALVLFAQFLGPRLAGAFFPPPPTQSAMTFEMASNVTWAAFSVGRRPAPAGVPFTLHPSAVATLISFTAAAPPFPTLDCDVSLPVTSNSTCSLVPLGHGVLLIAFRFTFDDLPPDQRAAVAALVNSTLSQAQPHTTIVAGAHYALGNLLSAPLIATQPLSATLLTARAPAGIIPDRACLVLCAPSDVALWTPSVVPLWHVQIYIRQQWRFVRATDGAAVGMVNEDLLPHDLHFDLHFNEAAQQWDMLSVAPAITLAAAVTQPLCKDGYLYVQSLFFVPASGITGYAPTPIFTDGQLSGCLVRLNATHGAGHVIFFWHTGILFTVNASTRQAEPNLPSATMQDLAAFGDAAA